MNKDFDFTRFTWLTPYQYRDLLYSSVDLTTELVQLLKVGALEEQARRKKLCDFVECPRCKGYHSEVNNSENLCEKCEYVVHIIIWDKQNL